MCAKPSPHAAIRLGILTNLVFLSLAFSNCSIEIGVNLTFEFFVFCMLYIV